MVIDKEAEVAEWSKAVDLGSIPKGRGFKPHLLHFLLLPIHPSSLIYRYHFSMMKSSLRTSGPSKLKMAVRKARNSKTLLMDPLILSRMASLAILLKLIQR
jgi:hypothetical protein